MRLALATGAHSGPNLDIAALPKSARTGRTSHSMTSSASARRVEGTLTSIACAVFRLMARVNRVGS